MALENPTPEDINETMKRIRGFPEGTTLQQIINTVIVSDLKDPRLNHSAVVHDKSNIEGALVNYNTLLGLGGGQDEEENLDIASEIVATIAQIRQLYRRIGRK